MDLELSQAEAAFIRCLRSEIKKARRKYPTNEDVLPALMEESGEAAQALLHHKQRMDTNDRVFAEAVQTAATAMRLAVEGDANFPYRFDWRCVSAYYDEKDEEDEI